MPLPSPRNAAVFLCLMLSSLLVQAQQTGPPQPSSADQNNPQPPPPPLTVFPHPDAARYLISGQANIVFQAHPGFHSPYQGANSLLPRGEYKVSMVGTLFLGLQLHHNLRYNTDAIYDLESSGGRGVSEALGLAGFTNLDVVRNPQLGPVPYTARVELHQTIGFTSKLVATQRTQFSLATQVPERRLDLRIGRMSLPDVLDINGPGSDSHLQFLNWTADNNGAWDYAADTRGYTYAAVAEYDDAQWSARYALALMPSVANGPDVVWNLRRARGENVELEYRKLPLSRILSPERKGTVRLIGYVNHGNMGLYRNAINAHLAGLEPIPDVTLHTPGTKVKYGVGLNFEQEITPDLRAFGRFGWNEGQHESYCYSEVDQTFQFGGDLAGKRWNRAYDKAGITGISNAIKRDHQRYLALGGQGFLLGDGRLNYGREDILELYYTAHTWRGLYSALDGQFIAHPGYNRDRGPVAVFSVRTHVDF
jgi:high affinity Mn2+ porin